MVRRQGFPATLSAPQQPFCSPSYAATLSAQLLWQPSRCPFGRTSSRPSAGPVPRLSQRLLHTVSRTRAVTPAPHLVQNLNHNLDCPNSTPAAALLQLQARDTHGATRSRLFTPGS